MNNSASVDPAKRQVLVNLGNRFVLFGPGGGLPEPPRFDPKDSSVLPRVADESEVAEARIVDTLQVFGMTRGVVTAEGADKADIALIDSAGVRTLVEVKVRERDPNERDFRSGNELLNLARSRGENLEVWFFNIERLKLIIMRPDGPRPHFYNLVPLNVWEKTSEGIFERRRVAEEVDDWLRRLARLYTNVREWLSDSGTFRFDESRTVTMSEEMMQKFAVSDRELPVLDVLRDDQVVASFVPRGLWLIGAWGRVDVITKDKTHIVVAIKKGNEFDWEIASPDNRRRRKSFDKAALLELLANQ